MTAGQDILAVLITKADSAYCERTLRSLFAQTILPERVLIGVVGADASPIRNLCASIESPCPCNVQSVGKASTFFEAVDFVWSENKGSEEWLWLLHEDSAPEAHCLENLVDSVTDGDDVHADNVTNIGIVGPKQVDWDNPNKLLEVGIRATRSARRVPDIGRDEYDQGQYDKRRQVLAVGSAGMFIRRSSLEEVGGLGEGLGPFGDGLELSRRMRAGGYDVIVCPEAKVRHKQDSLGEKAHDSFAKRRKAQIFNGLVSAPTLLFPFLFLFYFLGAFARAFGRLLTGKARLAAAELVAPAALLGSLGAVFRARRRMKRAMQGARRHTVGAYEDYPLAIRAAQQAHRSAGRDAADMEDVPDPLTEKAIQKRRQSTRSYAWFILAVTGLATAVAHAPRFSMQATGGALLPDTLSFREGIRTAGSSWLASGDGYAVPSDIFWAFLAPFSLVTSQLGVTATWIIFLAIIAAGLSAFIAAGDITLSPPVRAVGAVIWAFAPPLLDSVSAGHVAGVLAHICAPLAVMAYMRAWKGSVSALAAASVLCAFLSAASPMILVITIIAAIVGFIRRAQRRWLWLTLPIPAVVLLAPTLFAVARLSFTSHHSSVALSAPWRLLFSTPGAALDIRTGPLSLLSFSPLGSATFAGLSAFNAKALLHLLPIAIILVIAIVALMRPSRHRAIRFGWIIIALGWAWALAASYMSVGVLTTPGAYTITHGWTGIALSFAFLGVWIVVLNMAKISSDDTVEDVAISSQGAPSGTRLQALARALTRIGVGGVTLAAAGAALLYGGVWVAHSFTGSTSLLSPARPQAPALALADEESVNRSRVLMLDANEKGFSLQLWRGDGFELHETSMVSSLIRSDIASAENKNAAVKDVTQEAVPYGTRANDDLATAIASLSGDSSDVPRIFADHGVSVVLVPKETTDSASRILVGRLNAVDGLEYITANETGSFWRVHTSENVSSAVSRVRLDVGEDSVAVPSGVFGVQTSLDPLLEQARNAAAQRDTQSKGQSKGQSAGQKSSTPEYGTLVLAERADPYWHAELITDTGRQPLKARGGTWNQQWDVPLDVQGAQIVIYYGSPIQRIWPYVQLIVMAGGVLGIFVLPKRKR